MRKTKEFNWGWKLLTAVSSLVLVLMLGLLIEPFSIVSNAQSQGKVVVRSANIRKEADANSAVLGSAAQDAVVTINNQVTDSSGTIWYQVFVNADTLGYIRSDLVEVTDGTTPPTASETTNNTTTNTNENMAEVTAVEPMSASVTGSQSVRVRSNASTGSQIVTMAQNGLALTVTGQTTGTDGKTWYQVNFISDGSEVTGFIRSDYVALSGELVPVTNETETPVENETTQEPEEPEEPEVVKDWDTQYDDGTWYLIDNVNTERWDISNIFDTVKQNQAALVAEQEKVESRMVIIIVLVILAIAMAGVIAFLVFKIKDMTDSAYFAEVERETARRRAATGADKKVMHTVGADKKPGAARPAGAPAQGGQRPAGARPAGAPAQGGQRPTGARPAGAPVQGGQRPAAPTQNSAGQPKRPGAAPKPQKNDKNQNPGWKSKNFMTDDDEFEFEFLNWDGEDE